MEDRSFKNRTWSSHDIVLANPRECRAKGRNTYSIKCQIPRNSHPILRSWTFILEGCRLRRVTYGKFHKYPSLAAMYIMNGYIHNEEHWIPTYNVNYLYYKNAIEIAMSGSYCATNWWKTEYSTAWYPREVQGTPSRWADDIEFAGKHWKRVASDR